MSFTLENLVALDRLKQRFDRIANPDMVPLMVAWVDIIRTDNREGILAGTDRNGVPMAPVTYRPKGPPLDIKAKGAARLRHGQKSNRVRDLVFAGFGPHAAGLNNNLTSREYRQLSGPPLAPRGQFSRVISNLLVGYFEEGGGKASVWGYWDEVVDAKGRKFLPYLFEGKGRHGPIPRRDIRGVRPEGVRRAREAARNWMMDIVRTYG